MQLYLWSAVEETCRTPQQQICGWEFWILNDFFHFMPAWCLIQDLRCGLCIRLIASGCLVLHRVVDSLRKPSPISGRWLILAVGLGSHLRSRHNDMSLQFSLVLHNPNFSIAQWQPGPRSHEWGQSRQPIFYFGAGPCRKTIPVSVTPMLMFVVKPIIWQNHSLINHKSQFIKPN